VDDRGARAAGAAALVHYGHSCLVPVTETAIPSLYVFVGIGVDVDHLIGSVRLTWPDASTRFALAGTVQFAGAVAAAAAALAAAGYPPPPVPAVRPLSPGEVLGCTAPALPAGAADVAVFVADGRFHMEALMIANPALPAFRYDPYARTLLRETYDHAGMRASRAAAVRAAAHARAWVVVRGTLGRQGAPPSLAAVTGALKAARKPYAMVLASELTPARVAALSGGGGGGGAGRAWVQVACPRLSIDWGDGFGGVPVLTPYEAMVALGAVPPWWREEGGGAGGDGDCSCKEPASAASASAAAASLDDGGDPMKGRYAMDFYAADGGAWGAARVRPRPRRRAQGEGEGK
jgi:2-(3-amino-3-carboxypropyl)histidine synthase